MKDIEYSRSAARSLTRMPRNRSIRIRNKIRADADDPSSQANNVKRLRGVDGLLRLRVGDWRVIMRDAGRVQVLHIASRSRAYRE